MAHTRRKQRFALCIEDHECDDLQKGKVYQLLPDKRAAKEGYVRVMDESGEDYLYPDPYFISLELPKEAEDALLIDLEGARSTTASR